MREELDSVELSLWEVYVSTTFFVFCYIKLPDFSSKWLHARTQKYFWDFYVIQTWKISKRVELCNNSNIEAVSCQLLCPYAKQNQSWKHKINVFIEWILAIEASHVSSNLCLAGGRGPPRWCWRSFCPPLTVERRSLLSDTVAVN